MNLEFSDKFGAASAIIFFLVICYAAGLVGGRKDMRLCWISSLVTFALLPNVLGLWSAVVFALTSWIFPGRSVYLIGLGLIFFLAVNIIIRSIYSLLRSEKIHTSLPMVSVRMIGLSFVPLLMAIVIGSLELGAAHDISLYLAEASSLSIAMREGYGSIFGWMNFSHEILTHPHNLSYSHYFALGFIATDAPGFGNDLTVRTLILLSRISFLASIAVVPCMLMKKEDGLQR